MNWLWQVAVKNAIKRGIQALIAVLASQQVGGFLQSIGVSVTVDPVLGTAATYGALEALRNWLKHKVGIKFL